jgi:hypothetical protein
MKNMWVFRRNLGKYGAEGGTRTPTSYLTRPSNVRVYQFRHFGTNYQIDSIAMIVALTTSLIVSVVTPVNLGSSYFGLSAGDAVPAGDSEVVGATVAWGVGV